MYTSVDSQGGTTGLGVFALLQGKGLQPGSQAGWQHRQEWLLLQHLSLSLPHSWVSRLGHVPLHFFQDAFLARQLSPKPLCNFKIIPVWNIVNLAWCSCLLLCIWHLPSQELGGVLGTFAHPLLRPSTQQGLTANICLKEFTQVNKCVSFTNTPSTNPSGQDRVCETPKWSGTWKSYLVTKFTSSRALVHCYPEPSTVPGPWQALHVSF